MPSVARPPVTMSGITSTVVSSSDGTTGQAKGRADSVKAEAEASAYKTRIEGEATAELEAFAVRHGESRLRPEERLVLHADLVLAADDDVGGLLQAGGQGGQQPGRRVELADPATPRSYQPYHAATGQAETDVDRLAVDLLRRLRGDRLDPARGRDPLGTDAEADREYEQHAGRCERGRRHASATSSPVA